MPATRRSGHHRGWSPLAPLLLALTLVAPTFTFAPPARAAGPCEVTSNANSGAGTLREKLADASCPTVTFQAGLVSPITLTNPLFIDRSVTVTGPGAGALTLSGGNLVHVLTISTGTVAISDLTISEARTNGLSGAGLGVFNNTASPPPTVTLTRVTISGNTAINGGGGGIYASKASLTLIDSTVSDNTADNTTTADGLGGGGLFVDDHFGNVAVTLNNSTVSGNKAIENSGGGIKVWDRAAGNSATLALTNSTVGGSSPESANAAEVSGGGIILQGGTAALTDTTIRGNSAIYPGITTGGGIANLGGTLTVTRGTIADNTVSGPTAQGRGGGIATHDGTTTLTDSTVSGNVAMNTALGGGLAQVGGTLTLMGSTVAGNKATGAGFGGGINNEDGTLTVTNSTVSGNTATFDGGGIYTSGTTTVSNSTISGNSAADHGGGIHSRGGTLSLSFATVVGNSADDDGGGIDGDAGLTFGRSIIAGNLRGTAPDDCTGPITSQGYNVAGVGCPAVAAGDHVFVSGQALSSVLDPTLAANGGPTRTHALVAGSPAFNAATNCPATDQRGIARTRGATCDSGAYEVQAPILTATTQGGGSVTGGGPYFPGTIATLTPQAQSGALFTGWTVDGQFQGWAVPLDITMNADHAIIATFAPSPAFSDVGIGQPFTEAIAELAARLYIRGYGDGTYGPNDQTLRAQMAALIARAMGYTDSPVNPFTDRCDPADPANCVDDELWNRVAQLASRNIARGYTDPGTCAPSAPPCYAPRDFVLHAQVLSFITRAMVDAHYWEQQTIDTGLYGGVLNGTGHEQDVTTFVHYTGAFGVPDYPVGGFFPAWDQPAMRGWFARALWTALNSYWSVDRVP